MEKTWPEKYRTYDVSIKLNAIARYEAGGISLRNLSDEIGVNRSTLWSWVRKSRSPGMLPTEPSKTVFVDVTPEVKRPLAGSAETITLRINGVEVSTDSSGVKAIIEAIRR